MKTSLIVAGLLFGGVLLAEADFVAKVAALKSWTNELELKENVELAVLPQTETSKKLSKPKPKKSTIPTPNTKKPQPAKPVPKPMVSPKKSEMTMPFRSSFSPLAA